MDIWKKVVSKEEYSNDTKFLINLFKKEALRQGYDKNRFHNGMKTHAKESSLLTGKIFDDKVLAMPPSHLTKNNKRYRYYLSQGYIQRGKLEAGSLPQVPASDIQEH